LLSKLLAGGQQIWEQRREEKLMRLVVGITGATGAIYGIRLLEVLTKMGHQTELVISSWGKKTIELETRYSLPQVISLADTYHENHNLAASIASGSYKVDGTVIAPCSMKTLASIARGYSENLISRAGDVALKERRKLILVPRETPLNLIHLENMRLAAMAGAILLPPVPSFYQRPKTLDDIINQTVGKILDSLNIPHELYRRWTGENIPHN
jgi:4-hydroxy-3-polyprenylbenzoate decarboxylase